MNTMDDTSRKVQPAPVRVSRVFSAPRETVFKAWSSADHVKRWFCPDGYSVPEAKVEMRVGGAFEVCMRSPEGVEHWTKGTFTEVVAPERLTIDHHMIDPCGGGPLFSAVTEVSFIDNGGGRTLMEVVQTYTFPDHGCRPSRCSRARPKAGGRRSTSSRRKSRACRSMAAGPSSTAPSTSSAPTTRRRRTCTKRYRTKPPRAAGFSDPPVGGSSSGRWTSGSAAASGSRAASKAA